LSENRFHCTPGGEVQEGRRRLRLILSSLFFGTLIIAAITAWTGQLGSAFVCFLAALMPALAWRMLGDVDLLWLDLTDDEVTVRLRGQLSRFALAGADARKLDTKEISHLRGLATHGPIVATTGSYESSQLGELDLYATCLENAVLVSSEERQIVVTPDDTEGFIASVKERAPGAVSRTGPLLQSTAHE